MCAAPRHAKPVASRRPSQPTNAPQRARWVAVTGERRSANRSSWAQQHEEPNAVRWVDDEAELKPQAAVTAQGGAAGAEAAPELAAEPADEVWAVAKDLAPLFADIDRLIAANSARVQAAMAAVKLGPHHWAGSTGYGHGDLGREALDEIMAHVMGAESAMVRRSFMSGTHAIAAALFASLRPGDELLAVTGRPYDTMEEVIGLRGRPQVGSLRDWGVTYAELPLTPSGSVDLAAVARGIVPGRTRVVYVQRSCGYAMRPTLTIAEIRRVVEVAKEADPDCLVLVDNCYGEFTGELEPCAVGADLAMGSLIKNPGGTLAPGGGYVAGRADLLEAVSARLSAPGVGRDAGGVSGGEQRLLMQGLFLAPQMVGEAIKGGRLVAEVMHRRGFAVVPPPGPCDPYSFITAVELGSPELMTAFCRAVQSRSPVGSYIRPLPGVTAGYGDEVIFADGTFIDGSTSELSADGPLRPPFTVYCQGGTHWTHWALVLERVLQELPQP